MPIIVWFRRDLRIDDHPALAHAAATGEPIVPLFIFDEPLIRALPCDGAAFEFQAEALRELDGALTKLGGRLICRRGDVFDVHAHLIRELHPTAIYFNNDTDPAAQPRDHGVRELYKQHGVAVHAFPDVTAREPGDVMTALRKPYTVFTPFANAWKKLPPPEPIDPPRAIITPDINTGAIAGAHDLGRATTISSPAFHGGCVTAVRQWNSFLSAGVTHYAETRDLPAVAGTSGMSAFLRFGCISVRRMFDDCRKGAEYASPAARESIGKYVDELIWREFYHHALYHFPNLVTTSFRREFDAMPWSSDSNTLAAWRSGRTGFPLVDAGMRQLNTTGWMHNRVRMVVASFFTKDLMHDWREGQRYFEEKLLDIDTASNNGGWQWAASTGVDPRPLRIFNPRLQSEKYDRDGAYIRAFVPELRDVPARYIHAPHEMPPLVQEEVRCVIGRDYPAPIVDHRHASAAYKQAFAAMKQRRIPPL